MTDYKLRAIEATSDSGDEQWHIIETVPYDDGDTRARIIARYDSREEAVAFLEGFSWPARRRSLNRLALRLAIRAEES